MVDTPKNNVTGQFAGSTYGIGSRFRATQQPRVNSQIPNALLSLIQTGMHVEQTRKEIKENSPEEREYWIQQERLINETFAMNGTNNKTDPIAFKAQAAKDKEKLMRNVPDEKKERFSLMFESQMNGFNQAVAANRINLDYNRQLETFITESDRLRAEAMNATLNGDTAGYNEATQKWLENEDYMYNHGFISVEKKVTRLKDFTDGALIQQNLGNAKKLFGNTEQLNNYLQRIDKTKDYTPEQKKSIKNNIISEFSTWQALNKVAASKTSERADFGIKAYAMGLDPDGFDFDDTMAELKAYGQTEKAAALQAAYDTKKEMAAFAKLSLPQMEAEIQSLKKNAQNEYDLNKLKLLDNLKANAAKEIETDPLAYAITHSVVADKGLDITKPEHIQQRTQNAAIIKEKYNLDYTPIATKGEIKNISRVLSSADTETKAALIASLNTELGDNAGQIFQEVAKSNPELAVAAKVYNRNPEIAQNILTGMDIIANEKGFAPDNNMEFQNRLGELDYALSNFPTEDVAKIKAAIRAEMAYLNKKNNIFAEGDALSEDKLKFTKEAIENVLGGKIATQGGWWSGYTYVLLPENVSEDDFENWVDRLTDKDIGDVYFEDKKVNAKTIKDKGVFGYDDNNKYTISLNGVHLRNADGSIFVIEYGDK